MTTGWDELVAAALIGTDRRPLAAGVPDGSPPGLEAALEDRGVEDRLLGAAAAWTVARRAGAVAVEPVPAVEPAGEDPRPIAPGGALRERLEGLYPSLLGEWLELAAARGLRPPPELVPALLDHAAVYTELHTPVAEAAGPLALWLAERNPRWAFVRGAGEDVDAVWADGGTDERRALLERVRRTDPARAREVLEATFADETWEDRVAFLDTLAVGLSGADEPLLERALDDRRKPVRDAAAHLLTGLPRSRFAARMAERAAPLIRVEDGRLVVALPGDPDTAAKRDGVPATGRRSERLHALLAAAPLATWTGAEWSPYDAPPPETATGAAEPPSAAGSPADAAPAPSSPAAAAAPRALVAAPRRRPRRRGISFGSTSRMTSARSSAAAGRTRPSPSATGSGRGPCGRFSPSPHCSLPCRRRRRSGSRGRRSGRTSRPRPCPRRGARRSPAR